MRFSFIAAALLLTLTACDDVSYEDLDATTDDAGLDGDPAAVAPTVAPSAPAPDVAREPPAPQALVPLTDLTGKPGMISDLGGGSATGAMVRLSGKDSVDVVVRRGHRASADEQAMIGTRVHLHDRDGGGCIATVTGFVEVASVLPEEGTRPSNRAVWQIAAERGGVHVIAELSAPGCDDPIFADERADPGPVAAPVPAEDDSPVSAAALARLRSLPRFADAQAAYHQYRDGAGEPVGHWSDDASATVTALTLGGVAYVTAALVRDGHCGDFGATLFAIWRRDAAGAYTLVLESDVAPEGYDLAFDADADGVPELAGTSALLPVEETPWKGCGC